jgi:hypothetical protein
VADVDQDPAADGRFAHLQRGERTLADSCVGREFSRAEDAGGTTAGDEQRINRLLRSEMTAHARLVRDR